MRFFGLLSLGWLALGLSPCVAATIGVTTTADVVATDGECSLREAVDNANLAAGGDTTGGDCTAGSVGHDTIELPAGVYGIASQTNDDANVDGDFDVTGDLTLNGAGAFETSIVGPAWNLVHVTGVDTVVEIRGIAFRDVGPNPDASGAILVVDSTVRILDSLFEDNFAGQGTVVNAFYADITLERCVVRNNIAMKFALLTSQGGGGVLTVLDTAMYDNPAFGLGNRVVLVDSSTLRIERSYIAGVAIGVQVRSQSAIPSRAFIANSTLSGHDVGLTIDGGALVDLDFVTISGATSSGVRVFGADESVNVKNSILAGNGTDCLLLNDATITSHGYNLDSDSSCFGSGPTDLTGVSAELGPLQDNGGGTLTHALLPSSPAIDSADPLCADIQGAPLTEDQRGFTRPMDGDGDAQAVCDRGAYEAAPPGVPPEVPDGSYGSPLLASRADAAGETLDLEWDADGCPASSHHLVYGDLEQVGSYILSGSECALPTSGGTVWTQVPGGDLYFLVLAADGDVEGSWGGADGGSRNGDTPSLHCGVVSRINAAYCP